VGPGVEADMGKEARRRDILSQRGTNALTDSQRHRGQVRPGAKRKGRKCFSSARHTIKAHRHTIKADPPCWTVPRPPPRRPPRPRSRPPPASRRRRRRASHWRRPPKRAVVVRARSSQSCARGGQSKRPPVEGKSYVTPLQSLAKRNAWRVSRQTSGQRPVVLSTNAVNVRSRGHCEGLASDLRSSVG